MKHFGYFFLLLLLLTCSARAQSITTIRPLTVGDTLPDIVLKHIIRYKTDSARTGDFRGKVLILDFFATWCGSCREALPHLDSLQQYFGDKIRALVVDYEPAHKVDSVLRHITWLPPLKHLPIVTQDIILSKIFPHRSLPHEVIIDANGKIQAITYPYNLTKPIIQSVIDGKHLHLRVKKELVDYSIKKPLFYYGNGGDVSEAYVQSTFCHYLEGLPAMQRWLFSDSVRKRLLFLNDPITTLYRYAAYPKDKTKFNRMILEVQDSSRYIFSHHEFIDDWILKNGYCYELIAPAQTTDSAMRKYMLTDLNRSLHINGRIEKRMTKCWILVRTTDNDSLFKAKARPKGFAATFVNAPMNLVAKRLNGPDAIVLDETRYQGRVDINLEVDNMHDLAAVRKAIQPYGLDLVPTRRILNMLVLTENEFNTRSRSSERNKQSIQSPDITLNK